MTQLYQFQHSNMKFSEGGLDEKLSYDRYSTPEHDINKINIGDVVVCKLERNSDKRIIGTLVNKDDLNNVLVKTRTLMDEGVVYEEKSFHHELITKPLDLQPVDFWTRWAKAAASVENHDKQLEVENDMRWLFDDYKFSPGGRIQLMAGQEFVTGNRAHLSAFNCFVGASPEYDKKDWDKAVTNKEYALKAVNSLLDVAISEAQIMARGGGFGYSPSTLPPKILSPRIIADDLKLYLPKEHKDYELLLERQGMGKFDNVEIVHEIDLTYTYLKIEDSREGLLNGLKLVTQKLFDGEKVCVDFSDIRYKGALVKGVNGRSSGAPSWMELYNRLASILHLEWIDVVELMEITSDVTLLIEQGGSRRGALMVVLHDDHPNIRKFIHRKKEFGKLTGANISVGITNDFMKRVKSGEKEAAQLWNEIIESAWKSAEPGVLFIEYANEESNSFYYAPLIATNPCNLNCMAS